MNEIKVITELCAEDRARIDKLTAALEGFTAGLTTVGTPYAVNNVRNVTEAAEPEKVETPTEPESVPAEVGAPTEPEAPADEPEVKEVPEHTQAELQQKVISLVSSGKKDEVKAIVEQYAPRVSAIPAEKINEVWNKLTALEG